jgi:hypothetical protein
MDRAFDSDKHGGRLPQEPADAAAPATKAMPTGVNDFPNMHARRSDHHASSR